MGSFDFEAGGLLDAGLGEGGVDLGCCVGRLLEGARPVGGVSGRHVEVHRQWDGVGGFEVRGAEQLRDQG